MESSPFRLRAGVAVALVAALVVFVAAAATVFLTADSRADTGEEWASWWIGPELPEGSPYWWTASDQVGPGALKATLTDPEANEARYREAVRVGFDRHDPPLVGKDFRLAVYVHGSQTPDLMPLWAAFQSLWTRVSPGPYSWDPDRPSRELRNRLGVAGLSIEGAEAVVSKVEEANQEIETLNREAEPIKQHFYRVMQRAKWFLGESGVQRAIDLGNDALIARASFTGAEEVSRLREVMRTDYPEQVWLQATETLKVRLSNEDWEHFRNYLLDQVVPGHYYSDVEWRVSQAQPLAIFLRLLMALVLLVGTPVTLVYRRMRRMPEANG